MKQRQNRQRTTAMILLSAILLMLCPYLQADEGGIPQRADIDDKYKWNLEDMYPDIDAWENDFALLESSLTAFEPYEGHLGDSPETLLACLKLRDSLGNIDGNLYVYANLKLDEDNRISKYQELAGRIAALDSRLDQATAFIEPEILSLDEATLESFLQANEELNVYRFYIEEKMRTRNHVLSSEGEELLALVSPVARAPLKIFNMIDNADHKMGRVVERDGDTVELTSGRYSRLLKGTDRDMRRTANDTVQSSWLKYANTLAATLGSSLEKDLLYMRARKYNSCLENSLDGNGIPKEVFHNLIQTVNDNLSVLHKWTALRKKIMALDTMYTYDLSVPMAPEFDREYTYEEAKEICLEGLKPLGKEYLKNFKHGLDGGWVDVYETEGKGSGAYNWGTYTSHPYVLINFSGMLDNIFTLAHEMGHALHSYYGHRHEPYIYHGHSLFTAEVASTCNEAVLMKYLLSHAETKAEKISLLNHYIEQIEGTFFTQVMFSEYEQVIHEHVENGGATSLDYFRKTYRDIFQKYYGPDLVIGPNNDMGCLKVYHFYREYYVYQYATSYAAAQALSQKIMEDQPGALDKYLAFLTIGSSKNPVDILKDAGVDMTQPEPIERTIKLFGELVDEMERLLDES